MTTTITESVVADGSTVSNRLGLWSRSGVMVLVLLFALGVGGWPTWKRFSGERHAVRSMAVLPLQNLSGDPSQEYFADGMTEELITNLGKIADLRVISHTSVTRYKNTKKPLSEIAKELQVEAVVEGTVARSGDHVRVTANLIQAFPERHLWAESYDRDLRDVLSLQSELARAITYEVKVKLTPLESERLATAHPVNPESYQLYLKGRYFWRNDRKMD